MKIFGYEIRKASEKRGVDYVGNYSDALNFSSLRNQYTAMNVSAVYRAVEIISDSVAILPLRVKTNKEKHKEELQSHPLNLVFKDRNRTLTKYSFLKLLV